MAKVWREVGRKVRVVKEEGEEEEKEEEEKEEEEEYTWFLTTHTLSVARPTLVFHPIGNSF